MLSAWASQMSAAPTAEYSDVGRAASPGRPSGPAASPGTSRPTRAATRARRSGSAGSRPTNTGAASRTATGWMTSIVPTPVPTPRPLRNPTKTDQMAPATAAPPHRTSASGSPPVTTRASRTGTAPLSRSPVDDDRGPFATERAQGVGAARPPGADGPRVRTAGEAGHQDAHRDRADEVDDEHQDDEAEDRRIHRMLLCVGAGARRAESSTGSAAVGPPPAAGPSVAACSTPRVPSTSMTPPPVRPVDDRSGPLDRRLSEAP